jgi:hypothetical protein
VNEDDVNRLMLENANGKPLRDVLRQAFQLGTDAWCDQCDHCPPGCGKE